METRQGKTTVNRRPSINLKMNWKNSTTVLEELVNAKGIDRMDLSKPSQLEVHLSETRISKLETENEQQPSQSRPR